MYYKNGFKAYEGEFSEGNRIGKGTEFDRNGKVASQANYTNNLKNGQVIEYYGEE